MQRRMIFSIECALQCVSAVSCIQKDLRAEARTQNECLHGDLRVCYIIVLLIQLIICISTVTAMEPSPSTIELTIHSNHFSPKECLEIAGIGRSGRIIEDELMNKVQILLQTISEYGYPLARVDSLVQRRKTGVTVIDIFISEDAPLMNNGSNPPVGKLTGQSLLKSTKGYLDQLTDNGYPFAKVRIAPRNVRLNEDSLTAVIDYIVDNGPFKRINSVKFPSRKFSGQRLLTLESRIKRGGVFNRSRLERAVERLQRLDYIQQVGTISLYDVGPGIIDISIPVAEQRVNRFSGIVALSGEGDATGEARIGFGNILGTGRRLDFAWLGLNPNRKGIRAAYREPWLFARPLHAEVGLELWSGDTLGTTTRYRFAMDWEPAFHFLVGGALDWENIHKTLKDSIEQQLETTWFEVHGEIDYLDHNWNPTRGFKISTLTAAGLRQNNDDTGNSGRTVRRDEIIFQIPYKIARFFPFFLNSTIKDVSGGELTLEELIRIGGGNSVRGYSEDRYLARGAGWSNVELRWRPDEDGYLGLFVDTGWIYRSDYRIKTDQKIFTSFGVTGAILTRAGRIGIDLGLAAGEPIQQARLHVRVESWF